MAKRISSSSVNWSVISEAMHRDVAAFNSFKSKSDKYLRRVTSQPADLPKIDWSYYKNKISIPGMVETYKKGYESLNIPYPSDQGLLAKVDQLDAKYKEAHKQNMSNIKQEMLRLQEELKKLEAQMPYSEMNMEEFFVACPEHAINHDKPELYPHGEKDSSEKSDGHH